MATKKYVIRELIYGSFLSWDKYHYKLSTGSYMVFASIQEAKDTIDEFNRYRGQGLDFEIIKVYGD